MPTFTYKLPSATANTNMFMDKLEAKDKQTSENDTFNYDPNTSTVTVTTGVDINFDQTFINLYSTLWAGIKDNTGKHTYLTSKNGGNILDKDAIDSALRAGGANLSGLADAFKSAEYYVSHPSEYSEKEIAEKPKKEKKPKVEDETPRPPKPDRERNHPLRDAFAKLRAEKTEEPVAPSAPVTGKLVDDYAVFKTKKDSHIKNVDSRIENALAKMNDLLGINPMDMDPRDIVQFLTDTNAELNAMKSGLVSWKNGLQTLISKIPSESSLTIDGLEGQNEKDKQLKLTEIKENYAKDKLEMQAKVEEAKRVLTLINNVSNLDTEASDFNVQLETLRAELRNLQNPATPAPTGDDDEEPVVVDLGPQPTLAELRADRRKQKEEKAKQAEEARLAELADITISPDSEDPLAQWASDPIVGNVVATFGKQKQNMTENERGPIKLIESAQAEFSKKMLAGDFTVKKGLPEEECSTRQTEVAQAIEDEKQALLDVVNNATTQANRLVSVKQAASRAAQAAIDGASDEKVAYYAEFKTKIEEAYDGLIYDINQAPADIGEPAVGIYEATGLFLALDTLANDAVKVSAAAFTTPATSATTTIKLTTDKTTYNTGETITFTFSTDVDLNDLELTISRSGSVSVVKPEIVLLSGNQYQATYNIPQDINSNCVLKATISNTEQTATGSLNIEVKAAPATTSAPKAKTIGSLEITATPSRAKPGQTVELIIKAWDSDNKKLEGAKGDLVVKVQLADGDTFNLSSRVTEIRNGKYKVSYTIPGDAKGNITFLASSKTSPSIKKTTRVNLITTTSSAPKEDPAETLARLDVTADPATVQPGSPVAIKVTAFNEIVNQVKMNGLELYLQQNGSSIKLTDNGDGTYAATYTVSPTASDGTLTLTVKPSTGGPITGTVTLTVELKVPQELPKDFLGLEGITDFDAPNPNTKGLVNWPPSLYRDILKLRRSPNAGSTEGEAILASVKPQTQVDTATAIKVAELIANSSELNPQQKTAYLKAYKAELEALSKHISKQQKAIFPGPSLSSSSDRAIKLKNYYPYSQAALIVDNTKDFIGNKLSPSTYSYKKLADSPTLFDRMNNPFVAQFLELQIAERNGTVNLIILQRPLQVLWNDLNDKSLQEFGFASSDQRYFDMLKEQTGITLASVNTKLKKQKADAAAKKAAEEAAKGKGATQKDSTNSSTQGANVGGLE